MSIPGRKNIHIHCYYTFGFSSRNTADIKIAEFLVIVVQLKFSIQIGEASSNKSAQNSVPENSVRNCDHFCSRPLERCAWAMNKLKALDPINVGQFLFFPVCGRYCPERNERF